MLIQDQIKSVTESRQKRPMEIQAVVLPLVTLKSAFQGVNLKVESGMNSLQEE